MKKIARALSIVAALFAGQAHAQSTLPWQTFPSTGTPNTVAPASTIGFLNGSSQFVPASSTNPLPVNATVSASITGFTALTTGTPIAVTTGGVTGTLPAGTVVVATNVGATNGAYCALGGSATTSSQYLSPGGGWFAFTVGASTQLTCITSTSTTTVNMTGGSGIPTGTGGGGGGAGAITAWGGGTLGAMANYGTSPGAVLVPGVNAFVTNVPAVSQSGTWTVQPGNTANTTAWLITGGLVTWAGGTLGAMANYGTSPGAVLVPGVNSFITNVPAVSQSGTWTMQPGNTANTTAWLITGGLDPSKSVAGVEATCGSVCGALLLKGSSGKFYGAYANCTSACWLMIFNSSATANIPTSPGATTAGPGTSANNMTDCIPIPAGGANSITYPIYPKSMGTGIVAAISSTSCATYTASAVGFISAIVE